MARESNSQSLSEDAIAQRIDMGSLRSGCLARAEGCLLGQLAGDSLGGLVEFQTASSIRVKYPQGPRELEDGGTWGLLAGQPTDDSEMALMLARSIVRVGGYQIADVLDSYVHWFESAPFDIGTTTSAALRAARQPKDPTDRLTRVREHASRTSQANGSLMRISPLAIYGAKEPTIASELAMTDSQLTHPHPVCQVSCAVFVLACARAIAEGLDPRATYEVALQEAERRADVAEVAHVMREAADRPPSDYVTQQGWVLIALQNAFYQLLHAPTLEEGVVRTVAAGGDTDTNGAIAGALLGAVHGRAAVPKQWEQAILQCRPHSGSATNHPRPEEFWPVDALELAERLLVLGGNGIPPVGRKAFHRVTADHVNDDSRST